MFRLVLNYVVVSGYLVEVPYAFVPFSLSLKSSMHPYTRLGRKRIAESMFPKSGSAKALSNCATSEIAHNTTKKVPLCPMSCALLTPMGKKMKMQAGIVRTNDVIWQNCSSSFMGSSISVSYVIAGNAVATRVLMSIVQRMPKIKLDESM